jgi:hypothetical protein
MNGSTEDRSIDQQAGRASGKQESRPQQAGEGGTTRFGMEDGDNTDIPATGGPTADDEGTDRSA